MKRLLIIIAIISSYQGKAQTSIDVFSDHIEANGSQILKDYQELLSIPNVAVDLPNINRNAAYISNELEKRGVQTKLLRMVGTPPIVYGFLPGENEDRTLALYVHYDGQPVDITQWDTEPWVPTLKNEAGEIIDIPEKYTDINLEWRLYARSAGDDKGPILSILTALDAMNSQGIKPTSNLVFFFEGQEEAGSRQLRTYLEDNQDLVDEIDIWMFCDGPIHQSRTPQLVFGVRGSTGMEITVYGPKRPLHSGHYGNWAPVPGQLVSSLVASMKDEDGNVIIEGFYDDVIPPTVAEIEALASMPDVDQQLKSELALGDTEGSEKLYERLLYPSLTVRGISSGNVGALTRNVIPSTATVSLGIRLVPGCDPEKMKDLVEDHMKKQGFHIVREDPSDEIRIKYPKVAKVTRGGGYPAAKTSMDHPLSHQIIQRTRDVAGKDLVLLPTLGGSLPIYLFTDVLQKPAIIVPIANHDNNQHAANENIRVENLWYGIKLMGALMTMED
ncbi:DUG1 [Symbiodinium microadriaticum]|nr:DUG1 [Symbiodinium microadriaticum]